MSFTFVAQTHNLWGDTWAEERRASLEAFYRIRPPDILATQELRPWSRNLLDKAMPTHTRVESREAGWSNESNIWWNSEIFTLTDSGVEDVGILAPDAGLFWVSLHTGHGRGLVFSTAHLTWPGHAVEQSTRINQRTLQAAAITHRLAEIAEPTDDVVFATDINDIGPPVWEFGNAGYVDTFSALGRHSPPTHPVIPSGFSDDIATSRSPLASPPKAIDWIFYRGQLRSRTSEVAEFFHKGVSPSDHYPVVATLSTN